MSRKTAGFTLFLSILWTLCHAAAATRLIPADDPHFQYSGRINFTRPEAPLLYWPGTSITAVFNGSSLAVILDDRNGASWYAAFLDDDFEHPVVLDCEPGRHRYEIATTLQDTLHTLLLLRRTEASTGPTTFLGLELQEDAMLLPPPPKPHRKILFYGDSITCGMGNEAPDDGDDDHFEEENNFLAYGTITARRLDAEYMCIAKSGIGILISWFDLVMGDYFYRLDPDDPGSRYADSLYQPDVVVINLLQNDSWLFRKLDPVPTAEEIVKAYADFVRTIRRHHPAAFMVCALGCMDATRTGSPWPGYIERAVESVRREDGDTRIGIHFFPFTGWGKHPRVRHHREMGETLAGTIAAEMNWTLSGD